jgi:hypothetical protein
MGALRVLGSRAGGGALFRSAEPSVRVGVDKRPSAAHRPRGDPVRLKPLAQQPVAGADVRAGRPVSGATRHMIRSARYNIEVGILVLIAFAVFLRYALVSIGVCLPLIVLVAILFV